MAGAAPKSALSISVDRTTIARVAAALNAEIDGQELRRDLTAELNAVVKPALQELRASIRSAPSKNSTPVMPLRQAIARGVVSQVRTTGKAMGVAVRVRQTPNVRGFTNAGRRFNRASFRHPVYGNRSVWVAQVGKPEWFDGPMRRHKPDLEAGALHALDEMAERIARRSR